jgi:hypothetical protein
MKNAPAHLLLFVTLATPGGVRAQSGGYSPPIRIPTPITGKCINLSTDRVTVSLRRVITQKNGGLFTQDSKAGVAVMATLNGITGGVTNVSAKTPSVNQVDVQRMQTGQVSLALEYVVADHLQLTQAGTVTKNIQLDFYLAKTRGKNSFGTVMDVAGQVLSKLPIPPNPYTTGAGKFVDFANQAIATQIGAQDATQIASVALAFADKAVADVSACVNDGYQPTGAVAVFSDRGAVGQVLLPTTNLNQSYCFKYNAQNTYELQYSAKPAGGDCATVAAATWKEIPNDYVMIVVAAEAVGGPSVAGLLPESESARAALRLQQQTDLREATALCRALKVSLRLCGVRA